MTDVLNYLTENVVRQVDNQVHKKYKRFAEDV